MFIKIRTLALAFIACLLSFGAAAQAPAGWSAVQTDNNMTVMIPNAILNGTQIPVNSWIGAFYTLDDGTERCGGSWQFDGTFPISVTVFGDDGLTVIKDGFAVGEEVIWKLYDNGSEYYGDDVVGIPPAPANNVTYSVNNLVNTLVNILYTGTPTTDYMITGTITKETGGVLRSATVEIPATGATTLTDHWGTYRLYVTPGTSGTVVPSMESWGFVPAEQEFTSIAANLTDVDFTAVQFTVTGTILNTEGTPINGVTVQYVSQDGLTTITESTNALGNYELLLSPGATGTITPSLLDYGTWPPTEYFFDPEFRTITNLEASLTGQDFTGSVTPFLESYTLCGTVTDDLGDPIENVEVTFVSTETTATVTTTTDAAGDYCLTVDENESGVITPVFAGYEFTPETLTVTDVTANVEDLDFTGTMPVMVYSICGTITDGTNGIEDVLVTYVSGAVTLTAMTAADGTYCIAGVEEGLTGDVTPAKTGFDFEPVSTNVPAIAANVTDIDFIGTTTMFLISGTISEAAKGGVPGVTVDFGTGIDDVTTDASGYYQQYVPHSWSGIITPAKVGWTFTPETISLENVVAATPDQDFTGEVEMFIVSGFVTDAVSGAAINAVNVTFTGVGSTSTTAAGYYAMEVPYGYTGDITPAKPGYTFTPEMISLTNVTVATPAQDFAANEILYTISGTVLDAASAPVTDVLITFSNGGGSAITDVNGDYSIQVSYGYTGTATPLKTGYIFNPVNIPFNFVTEDLTDQDFLGAPIPPESFTLTGTIVDETSAPMSGVSVVFSNGGGTAITDVNGEYEIDIYGGYTGEAVPSFAGYFFDPVSIPVINLDDDMSGLDFQGMPGTLPPGWGYTITGGSHLISVPATINPTINGIDLMSGDWIGVFYMDGTTEVCGGAIMWNGVSAVAVTAYGDDATTTAKDGFSELETLNWKVYSQTAGMSFDAVATYNTSMPQHDGLFHTNGLSALTGLEATGETYTISGTITDNDGNTPMAGVTVSLNNGGGYVLTDVSGYYEVEVLPNWEGTAVPSFSGYHFTPEYIDYTAVTADIADQDYAGDINYYTITGYITNGEGDGLAGVTVFFDNDGGSSVTFPNGFYTRTVPYGYTGTSYASLDGYSFEPETYAYSLISENYTEQDFVGEIANLPPGWGFNPTLESHVISVPVGANPNINGVPLFEGDWIGVFYMDEGVEKCGGAAVWDGSNNIPVLAYGDDETTPEKDGFIHGVDEFIWKVYSYAAELQFDDITVEYDQNVQNHDGIYYNNGLSSLLSLNGTTDVTYTLSGVVTDVADGTPMADVAINLSDGESTVTDATGNYSIEVLFGWTGSVEAVYPRYSFEPMSYGFFQNIGDQADRDFEGTRFPFPPGWEYEFTDTEHTVSVMSFANPTIDGTELEIGDFIGVFYYDVMTNEERCAGYAEWTGENTAVVVYGDDGTTPEKDGMSIGEPFRWKVYSWINAMQYEAIANYDLTPPYVDGFFTINGLSRVVNMYANPLTILASATPELICYGANSQLEVTAAGGSGLYEYSWSPAENLSDPAIANPVATLTETTEFTVTVSTYQNTEMQSVTVEVHPMFEVTGGDAQTICYNTAPEDLYATAIGGAGTYSYQWQQEVEEVWVDITDATLATFNPGNLTETTDYRCVVTDECGMLYTPVITITVYEDLSAVAVGDQTICYNTAPAALQVTPAGGAANYTYQWFMDGVAVENATAATYQPEALMVTSEFYCEVSDDCGMVQSNVVTITVYDDLAATAAENQTICYGTAPDPIVATATGGAGNFTYQWQIEVEGVFTDIENASEASYQPETIYASSNYQCVVSDDCGTVTTNVVTITMYDDVAVTIAADQLICYYTTPEALTSVVTGGAGNYAYQWQIETEGVFVDIEGATDATYQPEALTGETHYQLVVTDDCATVISNVVIITIVPLPTANAGDDQYVCETADVQLAGVAENAGSVLWTTAGDGTFVDATIADAVYMPGTADLDAGTVTLTFTAYAAEPCTDSDMDSMVVDFAPGVTVNAGPDETICEGDDFQTMGFTTYANSVLWTTTGDGTFDDPTSTGAIYTPGTADIAAGSVVLVLGAEAIAPCSGWMHDNVVVTIIADPTVNAGPDATICGSGTHVLSATATNYVTALWTTDGDGTFDDASSLTAEYTPGTDDVANGGATLTLTVTGNAPCSVQVSDDVVLSVYGTPEVFAGEDAYTCEGLDYTIADATAVNASVLWTTNGTGTFDDATLVNPTYTPSDDDLAMGVVTLTITGTNGEPCNEEDVDSMELTVLNAPTINGGGDQDVCEDDVIDLLAIAEYYTNIEWTTSGDGDFGDPTVLETTYAPGANDIASGEVVLTITAFGESVCGDVSDDVTISIAMRADAFAGEDTKVCEGDDLTLAEATASNYVSLLWTTSGDGTFDDATAVNPIYTPGTYDLMAGSVELTISAEAYAACGGSVEDVIVVSIDTAPETPEMPDGDVTVSIFNETKVYAIDDAIGADSYEWEITPAEAGVIDGTGTEGTVTWNGRWAGFCVVRVRAINDCGESDWSDGLSIERGEWVGIDNENIAINVFPNPTTGIFTVNVSGLNQGVELSIMNYDGRLIHTESLENVSKYEHDFNLTQYPTGVYFLRLQGDNFLKVERIVVR